MHLKIDFVAALSAIGSLITWVLGWLPAVLACIASAFSIAWYIYRFRQDMKNKQ